MKRILARAIIAASFVFLIGGCAKSNFGFGQFVHPSQGANLSPENKKKLRKVIVVLIDAMNDEKVALQEMNEFAECAGFYEVSAEATSGNEAKQELLWSKSEKYELTSSFFGFSFTDEPLPLVEQIKTKARAYYGSMDEGDGRREKAFHDKRDVCELRENMMIVVMKFIDDARVE